MELHASRGGLTTDEASRRLAEVGPNEPARAPRTAGLVQILLLLANLLVIILLIASAASAILGERVEVVKRRLMRRLLGMAPATPVATSVTPAA
jgi:magnesium-transporting ATPase (P-type)